MNYKIKRANPANDGTGLRVYMVTECGKRFKTSTTLETLEDAEHVAAILKSLGQIRFIENEWIELSETPF